MVMLMFVQEQKDFFKDSPCIPLRASVKALSVVFCR